MRRYLRTSIRESAKIVDMHVAEQPNTQKSLAFLGIHHLIVHDLDEVILIGKKKKSKKI